MTNEQQPTAANRNPSPPQIAAALQRADFLDKLRNFESAGLHLLNAWYELSDEDSDATINGYPFPEEFAVVVGQWADYREGLEKAWVARS